MKRLMLLAPAAFLLNAGAAHASEAIPPLRSANRISWAMKCAGPMPKLLAASLAIICALAIISILYYKKEIKRGGGNDER